MKIITFVIFALVLAGCVVYPETEIYAPHIIGVVIDSSGQPIVGAKVSRIATRRIYENEHRYNTEEYYSQTVATDTEGKFELLPKSQIDWWHTVMDLPFIWCYGNFTVSGNGYKPYKTEFGDYRFFNENSVGCKGVKFEPVVTLQLSN